MKNFKFEWFMVGAVLAFVVLVGISRGNEARVDPDPHLACAEAHSDYIARTRANGQCLQTPGCWIMADDIYRMNQAQADAAAACPISVMTK